MNTPNPYLDFLVDPIFPGLNGVFVLPVNTLDDRTEHSKLKNIDETKNHLTEKNKSKSIDEKKVQKCLHNLKLY